MLRVAPHAIKLCSFFQAPMFRTSFLRTYQTTQSVHIHDEKEFTEKFKTHGSQNDEDLNVDVAIVGGGPSGLATAIRLKQLNPDYSVALLEKSARIGGHIISVSPSATPQNVDAPLKGIYYLRFFREMSWTCVH